MDTDLIEEARRTIIECGLSEPGQICGCSEEEIECLEKELEAKLPAMYRSFLKVMGKSAGRFMLGSDVFWNSLRKLRVWAKELLDECDISFALSDEVLVFYMHQGYVFMYFSPAEGDDPPVYLFVQGDKQPRMIKERFSSWLCDRAKADCAFSKFVAAYRAAHGLDQKRASRPNSIADF